VLLLDIVPPEPHRGRAADPAARNRFSAGRARQGPQGAPRGVLPPRRARRWCRVGNFDDDLAKVAQCDLIIEAVVENIDIKRNLFARSRPCSPPSSTLIASNTSGLRIADMLEGRSASFRQRFMVIHFFNPPRYMKLLELVPGAETDPAAFARVRRFGADVLGKGVVVAKDTTNFIGNRIGAHAMMAAIHQMLADGLTPEDVDAIVGTPDGPPQERGLPHGRHGGPRHLRPRRRQLLQLPHRRRGPRGLRVPEYIRTMVEKKLLGDKTKGASTRSPTRGVLTLDPYDGRVPREEAAPRRWLRS
jgi:3-hydroxyacyl-CoA dehydrogenase